MSEGITNSRLYMWRAVVAMAHADGVVTPHEISFLNDHIRDAGLSVEQMDIVAGDLQTPQDVYDMYARVTERSDRKDFFFLARALSWSDGDFDEQERHILKCLEKLKLDDDHQVLLEESRDIVNELELCKNQWKFKTPRSEGLFGFLNRLKTS